MKRFIVMFFALVCSLSGYAQDVKDTRTVVGVAQFTSTEKTPYAPLVTEKVVDIVTNTKRFLVVDRTSLDKIQAELELQKTEAFMDSKNLAEQDIAVAAEKIISGHINKIPILRMKDNAGNIQGYKCNISFQMKVVDVETGLSSEAVTFNGKPSKLMLSAESAVTEVMNSMEDDIKEYLRVNFPAKASLVKILESKGNAASMILLSAGKRQGIKQGSKFDVSIVEMIEGEAFHEKLGVVSVKELSGETFSKCSVSKKVGEAINAAYSAGKKIDFNLIIKK